MIRGLFANNGLNILYKAAIGIKIEFVAVNIGPTNCTEIVVVWIKVILLTINFLPAT